jgi:hypothetical protein
METASVVPSRRRVTRPPSGVHDVDISATTGVDKGIRFLSQLNVILALGMAAYVLEGHLEFLRLA